MTPPVAAPRPDLTEVEFWALFRSGKPIERCRVTEAVDIRNSGLPEEDDGAYIVPTYVVLLGGVRFDGKVRFERAVFERPLNIKGVTFAGNADFSRTTFRDDAAFHGSSFARGVTFQQATFHGPARFAGVTFGGTSQWVMTTFLDDVSFVRATFAGEPQLTSRERHKDDDDRDGVANFVLTRFSRAANFSKVRYWPDTLGQWWLYRFRGLFWRQRVSGIRSVHVGPVARRVAAVYWRFRDLLWRGVTQPTQTVVYDPRWLTRQLRRPGRYPKGPPGLGSRFVMDTEHIYEPTNPLFKRHVADQQFVRSYRDDHPRLGKLWRWSCDYGRSSVRWVAISLAVLLGSAWAYSPCSDWALVPLRANPVLNSPVDGWFKPVYFSVVTFATLGFGDITPCNTAGRVWVVGEVLAGYAMLGLLVSVVASRLLRRS
ncbi:MAG: potassium channel family protein [Gemmatimonadales bacterium]|jgi:hypothetical protein|nr:potassium channel family protein [Gemmatimonadales bacterium]